MYFSKNNEYVSFIRSYAYIVARLSLEFRYTWIGLLLVMAALCNRAGHYIFSSCGFFCLLLLLFFLT